MILPDVKVLVYAHREDAVDHLRFRQWLETILKGSEPYGISDHVLAGFLRVVTHPRVFARPSPLSSALEFMRQVRSRPHCRAVAPGPRHWDLFINLCQTHSAAGNFIPDLWFAALAIEAGCEWITTDRDYQKISGLRWRHPITGESSA